MGKSSKFAISVQKVIPQGAKTPKEAQSMHQKNMENSDFKSRFVRCIEQFMHNPVLLHDLGQELINLEEDCLSYQSQSTPPRLRRFSAPFS